MRTAESLWSENQLRVLRGLDIPVWVGTNITLVSQSNLEQTPAQNAVSQLPVNSLEPQTVSVESTQIQPVIQFQAVQVEKGDSKPIASLTQLELETCIKNCQKCSRGQNQTAVVRLPVSMGASAEGGCLIVVDETLASQDDLLNQASSALLEAIMASVRRSFAMDSQLTSVLKCATSHAVQHLTDPFGLEVTACTPYLERQIVLKQAKLIIAMGSFAAQSLMGLDAPLEELRGELHSFECEGYQGNLLVTHHLKDLLENPHLKRDLWQDLAMVNEANLI